MEQTGTLFKYNPPQSIEAFLQELDSALALFRLKTPERLISIDLGSAPYQSAHLAELFALTHRHEMLVQRLISAPPPRLKTTVFESDVRAGELLVFSQDVLIIGAIHQDAMIKCSANVTVLGPVCGKIHLTSLTGRLAARTLCQAQVRIYDLDPVVFSHSRPCSLYYADGQVHLREET